MSGEDAREYKWFGVMVFFIVAGIIVAALSGCSVAPAAKYKPGENFGNGGKTRCNTIQTHTSMLPMCAR